MKKLNEEQRQLVKDNYSLINYFIRSYRLSQDGVEDWHGLFAIALCKAALNFDKTRGVPFKAVAYTYIKYAFKNARRIFYRKFTKYKVLSIDEPIRNTKNTAIFDISNSLQFSNTKENEDLLFDIREIYEQQLRIVANSRHRDIINYYFNNKVTMEETAKQFKVSKQLVSIVVKKFINNIKIKWLEGEEY